MVVLHGGAQAARGVVRGVDPDMGSTVDGRTERGVDAACVLRGAPERGVGAACALRAAFLLWTRSGIFRTALAKHRCLRKPFDSLRAESGSRSLQIKSGVRYPIGMGCAASALPRETAFSSERPIVKAADVSCECPV